MRAGGTIWAVGLEVPLWRAVAVFRIAALGYAAVLMVGGFHDYARPSVGWVVLAVMAAWTGYATWAYAAPHRRRWPLLALDLAVAAACLGTSLPVVGVAQMHDGAPTLTMIWVAAPVIAWALRGGRRAGAVAALLVGAVDLVVRGALSPATVNGTVLMLVAGVLLGHVARVADQAQRRVQQAARREAAIRERERLARDIHDSVLQVLALVQRRGAELGGEAAELGRLAGEQEATLRALVTDLDPDGPAGPDGTVDLRPLLNRHASADVTVSAPAAPVRLPAPAAGELAAAVAAALDNVRQHAARGTGMGAGGGGAGHSDGHGPRRWARDPGWTAGAGGGRGAPGGGRLDPRADAGPGRHRHRTVDARGRDRGGTTATGEGVLAGACEPPRLP